MQRDVIGLRASPEVRALIEGYGTLSTAAQALMLIGAAAMGADLSPVHADLVRLLWAGQLDGDLRARIRTLLNTPLTERLTFPGSVPPEPPEALELDPFANIGIEV